MANQEILSAQKREVSGTSASKRLRREGIVPAVVYGSEQREYTVQVAAKEFGDLARKQSSENFLVTLEIDGAEEKSKLAIVQEIQTNALTGQIMHVDFHAVNENETIHANIPITLVGDCEGVKAGGILEHLLHSIDIHCRPADLPDRINHEVTNLGVGEAVYVRDLNFPEGVGADMPEDVIVAICNESRAAVAAKAGGGEGDEAAAAEGEDAPEAEGE